MAIRKEDIKKRIIIRLVKWKKWGGAHTENLIGGLPSHLRGSKFTKKVIKELVKKKWLIASMKTGEIHYSLNPKKNKKIIEYYKKVSD